MVKICMFCHKVNKAPEKWEDPAPAEKMAILRKKVSHGLCRSCMNKHYGSFFK